MNNDITVILNGYKRPQRLKEQIEAINKQTIAPTNIFYWQNSVNGVSYDNETSNKCISAYCNVNFGVWSRFAYALNARTNWICIFDDDTIPGSRWLENCISTYETHPGLLGTIGILFGDDSYYYEKTKKVKRIGWDNPNRETTQVDIVGHSWFFHRDMLTYFWRELPPITHNYLVGEDIHFSHMLQKYSEYKTWVPPHPPDNRELWGSLKGWEYGNDNVATAGAGEHAIPLMVQYIKMSCDNGFKFLYQMEK